MKYPSNFPNQVSVLYDLGNNLLKRIEEYEKFIFNNALAKRDLKNIDFVYMHYIILNLAKLLSLTKADKSGLEQLKKIAPKEIIAEIESLETTHKTILHKLTSNRNRIVAHIDISKKNSYFGMGFSEMEINKKIGDYKIWAKRWDKNKKYNKRTDIFINDLNKLKSTNTETERYSPIDFHNDIPTFKLIIEKVLKITKSLIFYYSKK